MDVSEEINACTVHVTITAPTLPYAQRVSELLYAQPHGGELGGLEGDVETDLG